MQRQLLAVATVVECLAGTAFVLMPGAMVSLLLGLEPGAASVLIARVVGVALFALGMACWGAGKDVGGSARAATLRAITFYNAVVGVLLTAFSVTGQAHGLFLWLAAGFHLILALAFVASLLVPVRENTGTGSR